MKIELVPEIKFTTEERHIADHFCEICENLTKAIDDCYDESDNVYRMIEENICCDWSDFMYAVNRFTSFIKSCEEN